MGAWASAVRSPGSSPARMRPPSARKSENEGMELFHAGCAVVTYAEAGADIPARGEGESPYEIVATHFTQDEGSGLQAAEVRHHEPRRACTPCGWCTPADDSTWGCACASGRTIYRHHVERFGRAAAKGTRPTSDRLLVYDGSSRTAGRMCMEWQVLCRLIGTGVKSYKTQAESAERLRQASVRVGLLVKVHRGKRDHCCK